MIKFIHLMLYKRIIPCQQIMPINHNPKYKNYTFEKALITTEGTQESLKEKERVSARIPILAYP